MVKPGSRMRVAGFGLRARPRITRYPIIYHPPTPSPPPLSVREDNRMAVVIGASLDRCFLSGFSAKPLTDDLIRKTSKKLPMPQAVVNRGIPCIRAALITNPDDFQVGRFVGSYGFMNITSYSSFQSGGLSNLGNFKEISAGYSSDEIERLRIQDVGEGQVKIRLYEGRVIQGPLMGTRVIFKVYPGQLSGGIESDMMAANELNAHAILQSDSKSICQNIQILLGGFETKTGEQWLAFRNDGSYSAADYAKVSSEAISKDLANGAQKLWNPFEVELKMKRRRFFVLKLLNGAINGLAYMHDHDRLHQSLGPASVVLNTIVERDVAYLVPRLRDFAFSVDIGLSSLEAGPGLLSDGLWRRASSAGASAPLEKRAYGIADDIYEAGLLFAYMAFVPFCEVGVIDGLSLQRLFESTFRLDLVAAREYCLADDHLTEAVKFLDLGDGAGWELLQAMLNPDYRRRPIAEAVLNHRFMTGRYNDNDCIGIRIDVRVMAILLFSPTTRAFS